MTKLQEIMQKFEELNDECQDAFIYFLLEKKWNRFVRYIREKDIDAVKPECKD
jgi:hypothetical protein